MRFGHRRRPVVTYIQNPKAINIDIYLFVKIVSDMKHPAIFTVVDFSAELSESCRRVSLHPLFLLIGGFGRIFCLISWTFHLPVHAASS